MGAEVAKGLVGPVRRRGEPVGAEADPREKRDQRHLVKDAGILHVARRAEQRAAQARQDARTVWIVVSHAALISRRGASVNRVSRRRREKSTARAALQWPTRATLQNATSRRRSPITRAALWTACAMLITRSWNRPMVSTSCLPSKS